MADPSSTHAPCALITGATGLLGRKVVAAFTRAGWVTINTGFTRSDPPRIYRLDLSDENAIAEILDEQQYELPPQLGTWVTKAKRTAQADELLEVIGPT